MNISRRLFLLSPLALACKPSWGALSFPLPTGHFMPAKMPMHPVFPRPDTETQAHARHRWAHPDFRYEIPIGVQGGAWPFKYEIISGPAGATIGQYYGDPDYGVVKWTPANGDTGTKTFTVRVTDQELNTVDLTWTTTIDPTRFLFLDANNGSDTAGDGSIGNPFATPASWYGPGDKNTVSNPDKIIVYRNGTYTLQRYDPAATWVSIQNGIKPNQHIKFPGESPFIDCSVTGFVTVTSPDVFVNVDMGNTTNQQNANAKCIWITGTGDRVTLLGNISNLGRGTVGNDNPAGYMFGSTRRSHVFFKGGLSGNNTAPFCDIYGTQYCLIEGLTLSGSTGGDQKLLIKSDNEFVTVRNIKTLVSFTCAYGVIDLLGQEQVYPQDNIEVCWNWIDGPGSAPRHAAMATHWSPQNPPVQRNIYIYRNTIVGKIINIGKRQRILVENNVLVSDFTPVLPASTADLTVIDNNNIFASTADQAIDIYGALAGTYRSNYLGIRGHELSSVYRTVPKPPSGITIG